MRWWRIIIAVALAWVVVSPVSSQPVLWLGDDVEFSKPAFADPLTTQDVLTPAVKITRANNRGIYNIAQESNFDNIIRDSPIDTEWAFAGLRGNPGNALTTAENFAALSFSRWNHANNSNPPDMVGRAAVVHLISDDIYLNLKFTEWGGANSGGAFTYTRSTPTRLPVTTTFNLRAGLNALAFTTAFDTPILSDALATADRFGAELIRISRINAQTQRLETTSFLTGSATGDLFPIEAGTGYLVEMSAPKIVEITGLEVTMPIDLKRGTNLVGFSPVKAGFGAHDLLGAFGDENSASAIARLNPDTGRFETSVQANGAVSGPDFPIVPNEAYLISMRDNVDDVVGSDADGDGVLDFLDCAIDDPAISPLEIEICGDSIDNDCSGLADDLDIDQDQFIALACGGDDTDDNNFAINPAAAEICNDAIDNNGNGLVDADDRGCIAGCDLDGDGFAGSQCAGDDRDDGNNAVFPGAAEICGDGIDNNQDNLIDEDCAAPGEVTLVAASLSMVAGESRVFQVLDSGEIDDATPWIYSVNGIEGGDVAVGIIRANQQLAGRATFVAPNIGERTTLTLTVTDPAAPGRTASVDVDVFPLLVNYVITPLDPIVGVGKSIQFAAAIEVVGVGIFPLTSVVWQVNGVAGGGVDNSVNPAVEIGRIDANGRYKAPRNLPDPLPFGIQVGYSLGLGQLPLVATDVTLAELVATPSPIVGLHENVVAGTITATLTTNDGASGPRSGNQLLYSSFDPGIAGVDANGDVRPGPTLGQTVIVATDQNSGASDTITVFSRTDIELAIEVIPRSHDDVRIDPSPSEAQQVEYTCPRSFFELRASVKRLRGPQAGAATTGIMRGVVEATVSGDILAYEPPDQVPQATGVVATLRKDTGFVTMGDTPGTGTITLTYDDGFVNHQASLQVSYTRPQISVTAVGRRSALSDPFLTEEIVTTLQASNPTASNFVGQLPMRITLLDSANQPESFDVWYRNSPFSGNAWGFADPLNLGVKVSQMELTSASNLNSLDAGFNNQVTFRMLARSAGAHTIKVENRCDNLAPPATLPLTIIKPPLALQRANGSEIDPMSPWVVGSWLRVFHRAVDVPERVSIYDLYSRDSVEAFQRNDVPRWHITDPGGITDTIPVVDDPLINASNQVGSGGKLPFVPDGSPGQWRVNLAFSKRPYLMSEDLLLNIVEPTSVIGEVLNPSIDPLGAVVAPANTLGALRIVDSPAGSWKLNEPFTLSIDTYSAADTVPKPIGRRLVTRRFSDGDLQSETISNKIIGVSVSAASSHTVEVTGERFPVDASGRITLTVTPTSGDGNDDLILQIEPATYAPPASFENPGLALEIQEFFDGVLVRTPENGHDVAIADFADQKNESYYRQFAMVQGRGLVIEPRQIPITSQRVRDAVTQNRIPAGSDKVVMYAEGAGAAFRAALGAGIPTGNISGLPAGVVVEQTSVENGRLKITLDTGAATATGRHDVNIQLNDGEQWQGAVQLVQLTLAHPNDHANEHVPLNGNHHQQHPVGTNMVIATENFSGNPAIPNSATLHLFPSLQPGGSPVHPQAVFRGLPIEQPIIGWRREENALRQPTVSVLEQDWLVQRNNFVIVYGNTTDAATLDPGGGVLNEAEGSDLLADFVSPTANAETVAVSVEGNFLDAMFFTAFNFVAKPMPDVAENVPDFNFENIKGNPIDAVYGAYRSVSGSQAILSETDGAPAGVSVDTETDNFTIKEDQPFKQIRSQSGKVVAQAYHGGVLDQYYLAQLQGSPYVPPGVSRAPLGQDGRVGGFDGESGNPINCNPVLTGGAVRKCFGIELDGVIFDPSLVAADEAPNDSAYFDIPIIAQAIAPFFDPPQFTSLGLVPDIGGTSGGIFHLDTQTNFEALADYFIVSKTPGQDFPGMHAGYLIQGAIDDLVDPYTSTTKDDIEEAALLRQVPVGPLLKERSSLFFDPRRVMTFGSQNDHKNAISTSLARNVKYAIATDPPNVNDIEFRAALQVRELPRTVDDVADLIVTTQSDGYEDIIKLTYDKTIDIAAEVIAKVALSAVTGGAGAGACVDADIGLGDAAKDAFKTTLEKYVVDAVGIGLHTQDHFAIEGTPLHGRRRVPQVRYSAIDPDVLAGTSFTPLKLNPTGIIRGLVKEPSASTTNPLFSNPHRFTNVTGQFKNVTICQILKLPFSEAAKVIKNLVTKEGLGGGGAGRATATKIIIVHIPEGAAQSAQATNTAWFQLERSIMITPDEASPREPNFPPGLSFVDAAEQISDREFIRLLHADLDSTNFTHRSKAQLLLRALQVQGDIVKRLPTAGLDGELGLRTYEDYRLRFSTIPPIEFTVTPNGTVGDYKLTTGKTEIPITSAGFVTALRSNQNAGARATMSSRGIEVIVVGATIPGPNDP